jgi:methylated-DNA-protein-cysteine methyltransferase-like protein
MADRHGGPLSPSDSYARIYAVVARIPPGRVATYGQVAALAGLAGHARQVGYALHATPEDLDLPWHRVINAKGEVSPRAEPGPEGYQRHLLEEEGLVFNTSGRLDLERYRWEGEEERPSSSARARSTRRRTTKP